MSQRLRLVVLSLPLLIASCTEDNPSAGGGPDAALPTDDAYAPVCGNGIKDEAEQCDTGSKNAHGSGCEPDCTFTCVNDDKCSDGDPCNGTEACLPDHTCKPGTALADGVSCGMNKICRNGVCGDA